MDAEVAAETQANGRSAAAEAEAAAEVEAMAAEAAATWAATLAAEVAAAAVDAEVAFEAEAEVGVNAEVAAVAETNVGSATRGGGSSPRLATGGRIPASEEPREAAGGGGDGAHHFTLPGLNLTMAELEAVSTNELHEAAKMFARAVQLPGDTDSRARIVGALNVIQRTIQRRKAVEAESEDEVAASPPLPVGPGRYCPPRHRLPFDSRHDGSDTSALDEAASDVSAGP